MLLTTSYERRVDALSKSMKDLNEVSLKRQQLTWIMWKARAYPDFVLDFYPILRRALCRVHKLCKVCFFESAVNKIRDFREEDLTETEKQEMRSLLIEEVDGVKVDTASDSIVERALKRLHTTTTTKTSGHMNKRYLVPTSNYCERLFSTSGHALSSRLRGFLPMNFESQLK